jgi:outer membrane immunogenic protein
MNKISTLLCAAAAVAALSAPATAADMRMPVKAAPPVAAIFNWTGFYIGVNGGGAFGSNHNVDVTETFNNAVFVSGTWPGRGTFGGLEPTGGFGGGQIGYNWQAPGSIWVWGVEADLQGASIKDDAFVTLPYISAGNTISIGASQKLDWFGTVRGRVGIAFDRVLLYATGGLAFGQTKFELAMTDTFGFVAAASDKDTRAGWVAGAGVEWAFAPNWSLKGEYQFIDLGRRSINVAERTLAGAPTLFAIQSDTRTEFHTGRIGVNYRF